MKELKQLIKEIIKEEYRGFKKGEEFKLSNTVIDPNSNSSESTVRYLPKFTEIRRNLTKYGSNIKTLTSSSDEDIADAAKLALKKLQEANSAVYELNKAMDLHKNLSKYL